MTNNLILIFLPLAVISLCILFYILEGIRFRVRKKKIKREMDDPVTHMGIPGVKLKKDIWRNSIDGMKNIGGKIGYISVEPSVEEIIEKACCYNPACLNLVRYRNDLFKDFDDYEIADNDLIKDKARNLKYYYIKIKENDQFIGYMVVSDEIEEYLNC